MSVTQTNAREIKNLTQVIAKAQEDKALLEAQEKTEKNIAKIQELTTLINQSKATKKTIEDNAQDIERFRLKIKAKKKNTLEEEKANAPAIHEELKEFKELRKQINTAFIKYKAAVSNSETEASNKAYGVYIKAQKDFSSLETKIKKAITEGSY